MQLVNHHGPFNWVQIAQTLGSRTPKQCRERYHQNLKPSLNHNPITPEEGLEIERLVQEVGKRWAEIARRLDNRSDNAVKNWWNGNQNRRKRRSRDCHDVSCNSHWHSGPTRPNVLASPSVQPSGLMRLPHSGLTLPPPNSSQPPYLHNHNNIRRAPWVEPSLPSPSSSESAESEMASNYTTSPNHQSLSLSQPVDLPPVRDWGSRRFDNHQLPGFRTLAPPSPNAPRHVQQLPLPQLPLHRALPGDYASKLQLDQPPPHADLPTAPSSPRDYQHQKDHRQADESSSSKDARLSVASLLTCQRREA